MTFDYCLIIIWLPHALTLTATLSNGWRFAMNKQLHLHVFHWPYFCEKLTFHFCPYFQLYCRASTTLTFNGVIKTTHIGLGVFSGGKGCHHQFDLAKLDQNSQSWYTGDCYWAYSQLQPYRIYIRWWFNSLSRTSQVNDDWRKTKGNTRWGIWSQ